MATKTADTHAHAEAETSRSPSRSVARLHVTVPEGLQRKIDELAEASHATSTAEVFRNALTAYAALLDAHTQGRQVIIQNPDGTDRERLRLFL